jgi:cytochrome c-type biogenesis protein CcmE
MRRRKFLGVLIPAAVASAALAQETKPDRLSGRVKSIDKKGMVIEMYMRRQQSVVRKIMYDANTKFTVAGKAGKPDDVAEGMRIVAIGKFDGVNLKATDINLTAQ